MNNENKVLTFKISVKILIILFIILLVTVPSRAKHMARLSAEYNITCEQIQQTRNICYRDGELVVSTSSHFKNAIIYSAYEITYTYESGEKESMRTFGLYGFLFASNHMLETMPPN